nr:DHH family phosphoesterase [Mycoplasmopsis caviae]
MTYSNILAIFGICISVIIVGIFGILALKSFLSTQAIVKKSFNSFIDEIISHNAIGVLIFDSEGQILWTSKFIKNRFGRKWVGSKLVDFFKKFNIDFDSNNISFEFSFKDFSYTVNIWPFENCLSIKDNTLEQRTLQLYEDELTVLGEIEIDNYQLYQSILSEEQLYNVTKEVVAVLDDLVCDYNLVYRQYNTNGKFLIVTNKQALDQMSQKNFKFFDNLHNSLKSQDIIVSVSAGFAYGTKNLWEKMEQAKNALLQAQSRGGDQVAIFSRNNQPRYYGSTSEILPNINRAKIKSLAYSIEKKLLDPNIKRVIVYGHMNADLDAIGSALGIYAIAKTFNKDAYICTTTQDATTKKAISKYFGDESAIFIKTHQANTLTDENTIVFLVDNALPNRTDNAECVQKVKNTNIFILDHHRLNSSIDFCPKINRHIEPSSSSASEIVTELMFFINRQVEIKKEIAQMLLNGIYLDTLQFQKHVSSRTFEAASWLKNRGADSTESSNILKIDASTYNKVAEVLKNIEEVKPGFYLAYKDIPLSNDVISIAAEEILRISGRKASFVVARSENDKSYKLSARGIDTNVQIICEAVGGGGHFGTAAAVTKEDLKTFVDNIKQAIVSVKHESNID